MPTTRPFRDWAITIFVKAFIPAWWQVQLFKAVVGAVWLAICIVALTTILILADVLAKGG